MVVRLNVMVGLVMVFAAGSALAQEKKAAEPPAAAGPPAPSTPAGMRLRSAGRAIYCIQGNSMPKTCRYMKRKIKDGEAIR